MKPEIKIKGWWWKRFFSQYRRLKYLAENYDNLPEYIKPWAKAMLKSYKLNKEE